MFAEPVSDTITRATDVVVSEEVGRVISGALHDAIFDAVTSVRLRSNMS